MTEQEFDIKHKKKNRARKLWRKLALSVSDKNGRMKLVLSMAKKNLQDQLEA